jgi:hypothetical protein
MRSRAESLPAADSRARRSGPPPSSAMAWRAASSANLRWWGVGLVAGGAGCSAAAIGSDFSKWRYGLRTEVIDGAYIALCAGGCHAPFD